MRGVTICMPPTRAVSGVGGPSTAGVSSSVGVSSVTGHGPRFGLMSGVSGLRISILDVEKKNETRFIGVIYMRVIYTRVISTKDGV